MTNDQINLLKLVRDYEQAFEMDDFSPIRSLVTIEYMIDLAKSEILETYCKQTVQHGQSWIDVLEPTQLAIAQYLEDHIRNTISLELENKLREILDEIYTQFQDGDTRDKITDIISMEQFNAIEWVIDILGPLGPLGLKENENGK